MRTQTFEDARQRFAGVQGGGGGAAASRRAIMYSPDATKCAANADATEENWSLLQVYLDKCDTYEFHSDVCSIVRRYFVHDPLLKQEQQGSSRRRTFVESGALDGSINNSMTHILERYLGHLWVGLSVEATPANFVRLIENRPCTFRTEVALGPQWGLANFVGWGGCCSGSKSEMSDSFVKHFHGKKAESYSVLMAPATEVFLAAGFAHIDFWSLDVEGAELQVLQGVDWDRVSVGMIMIEAMQATDKRAEELLVNQGFGRDDRFTSWHDVNQLWVHKDSERWILDILDK